MADAAVVWAPATPASTHHDVKARAGLNSFSSPPTIAQINASSDWYQVAALYNRRASQIFASPTTFTLATDTLKRPTAASINSLRSAINDLRKAMQISQYTFGSTLVQGMPIRALHLTDLRTAIGFGPTLMSLSNRSITHIRVDHPYGTQTSESSAVDVASGSGGSLISLGNNDLGGSVFHRDRLPITLNRVQSLNSGMSLEFDCRLFFVADSAIGNLYMSNTDDSGLPSGYENNLNSLCASQTLPTGSAQTGFGIPISTFNARSTSNVSLLFCEANEAIGVNGGSRMAITNLQFQMYNTSIW